ncbi:SRPBCC family protein [Amycolatopsis sp. GM8]|uniref:SRPBCC family protein n=1 Tax=Amycolatopsis sp. GM8 TaxID=2896530 RepID=UPI001F15D801|nr:SRPBCC family protein [Amycolatopsis sp. GM8]
MTDLVFSVDIEAPAGTTWLALTDWARANEWILATDVQVIEGDGRSVGTRLSAFTGLRGLGFTDTMEITAWEPPVRCTVRHLGSFVRGNGAFHVHAKGPQASTFVWSESLELPFGPFGRLSWPVTRPMLALGFRQSLKKFAQFAENYTIGAV